MKQKVYTTYLTLALFLTLPICLKSQFYYNDSAKGINGLFQPRGHAAKYTAAGRAAIPAYYPEPAFAKLTASDTDGNGWLRLTEFGATGTARQIGYVITNDSYPSNLGIVVEFDFMIWGDKEVGSLADGFSVFLYDGALQSGSSTTDVTSNFRRGRAGGCLGYIPLVYGGTDDIRKGLKGGYLGVGIDAYGNGWVHSKENEKGSQGTSGQFPLKKNTILLWGPSSLKYNQAGEGDVGKGYKLEAFTTLSYNLAYRSAARPSTSNYYRKAKIQLTPQKNASDVFQNMEVKVYMTSSLNGAEVLVMTQKITNTPPAMFKIGFAAATGGLAANMEVRNIRIKTPGIITAGRGYINCFQGYSNFSITSMMTNFIKAETTGDTYTLKAVDKLPPYFVPDSYKVYFKDDNGLYKQIYSGDVRYPVININSGYTTTANARTYTYIVPLRQFGITYVEWHGHFVNKPTNDQFTSNLDLLNVPDYDDKEEDNHISANFTTYLVKPKDNQYVHFLDKEEATVVMLPNQSSVTLDTELNTTNGEIVSYTWEKSDDILSGSTWTTVSGKTASSLQVDYDNTCKNNIKYYRCNVYKEQKDIATNATVKCIHNRIIYKVIQSKDSPF